MCIRDRTWFRLKGPESKLKLVKSYTKRAKVRIAHRAAAAAWAQGVPWGEALSLATSAMAAADGAPPKLRLGKSKGKGRGGRKGNAKGKGRSK